MKKMSPKKSSKNLTKCFNHSGIRFLVSGVLLLAPKELLDCIQNVNMPLNLKPKKQESLKIRPDQRLTFFNLKCWTNVTGVTLLTSNKVSFTLTTSGIIKGASIVMKNASPKPESWNI